MKKTIAVLLIIISSIFYYHRNNDKKIEREDFITRTKWLEKDMELYQILNIMKRSPDNIYDRNNKNMKEKNRYMLSYYCDFLILHIYMNDSLKLNHIDLFAD